MLWVVLKLVTSARILPVADIVSTVVDVIPIKVVVVIDVDVAATIPIAITPPIVGDTCPNQDTSSEGETHSRIVTRIAIRIVRIGRRPIDHGGIVGWDINGLRVRLLDNDHLFVPRGLRRHLLFLAGLKVPFGLGFAAHPLDGIHHIRLLCQEGVS